ncbi:uncharacterized protein EV154DRAFT_409256, partial [Mucor mucedo]|uniref:uncharacterized protein n=1 Tax=Mucor mucedo TaxID=29922 RepID=UPI002220FC62
KRSTSNEYKCSICERVFQKKYNLDTHVKTHDKNRVKNFSCTDCDMLFDRKSHLNRHTKTVHQQRKEHICGHCGSQYTRSENLRKHVDKNHGN